jgi:uncharacterized protein YqhQ
MSTATPSPPTYGGQAVVEGVMIRGERTMAIAVRRPDGEIETHSGPLGMLYLSVLRRAPLLRGVLVLWETLALGIRALSWSSGIAEGDLDESGQPPPLSIRDYAAFTFTMTVAVAIFFAGPVLATVWLDSLLAAGWIVVLVEGAVRFGLLVGYIWVIGQTEDIQRIFQYHGAEHMTIHALENGALGIEPQSGIVRTGSVAAVRRFERAHPRCGTSFLLTIAAVSVVVFLVAGTPDLWLRLASRVVLIPLVASLAYEVIRFAGRFPSHPLVHWLFAANLALQRLTTREPDDEQIQVAVAALSAAIVEDHLAGSTAV